MVIVWNSLQEDTVESQIRVIILRYWEVGNVRNILHFVIVGWHPIEYEL